VHRDLHATRRTCSAGMQSSTRRRTRGVRCCTSGQPPLLARRSPSGIPAPKHPRAFFAPPWFGAGGWDHHDGAAIFVYSRRDPGDRRQPVAARHLCDGRRTAMTLARQAAGDTNMLVRGAARMRSLRRSWKSSRFLQGRAVTRQRLSWRNWLEFERSRAGHCILGSCVGSAYVGGQP
jgi:hypothetical protein